MHKSRYPVRIYVGPQHTQVRKEELKGAEKYRCQNKIDVVLKPENANCLCSLGEIWGHSVYSDIEESSNPSASMVTERVVPIL